jgi:general secretion pathway protein I
MNRQTAQSGFTLLEAIVALVLISGTGMALFGWINTNIATLYRVQETSARAEATRNALEYLRTINTMQSPVGEIPMGGYSVRWRSSLLSPVVDGVNRAEGISLYQFALYETHVEIIRESGESWIAFELRQVGYKKVRTLILDDS